MTLPRMSTHVARAVAVWAQAGIEVRERSPAAIVPPPLGLLDVDHKDDRAINLTDEEKQLVHLKEPSPPRSPVGSDFNVYYVKTLEGDPSGIAYIHHGPFICVQGGDPDHPELLQKGVTVAALAHEMGHHILKTWPGDHHKTATGAEWPVTNIMHRHDTEAGRDLDRSQVEHVVRNTASISTLVLQP